MPKIIKKKPKSSPVKRLLPVRRSGKVADNATDLKTSVLRVFDIPLGQLVEHEDNANQQPEAVFDELVDRIKTEGFDEPIIVYPELAKGQPTGKYKIASGHHRKRAAELAGFSVIPAVIRQGWDEDRAMIELIARNNLRGNTDPEQFTKNYNKLKERYDENELKRMMGLSHKKQFEALYKGVKGQLSPRQQKQLEAAKEEIKSVEDLSAVLNQIFREHGTKLDKSMLVFSFGGKEHIYIQVDKPTLKRVKQLSEDCEGEAKELGAAIGKLLEEADTKVLLRKVAANVED